MEYISVKETAEKWNISVRAVQTMCKNGLIWGVQKWERSWMVPSDAVRPADKRMKEASLSESFTPSLMPRESPFICFTDLYQTPGEADDVFCRLKEAGMHEAAALYSAQISYYRGDIDKALVMARDFLNINSDYYTVMGSGAVLSVCAMYLGDAGLWTDAKKHIFTAPCRNDTDREVCSFWIAATDSSLYDGKSFPEWFTSGCFDILAQDSYPLARFFYIKFLLLYALELASGKSADDRTERLGLMKVLPNIIEPMISQSRVDKVLLEELYLRLLCAVAYHNIGKDEKAVMHIDKAIALALPDGLYGILTEHIRPLDKLLDNRLKAVSPDAQKKVRKLNKQLMDGWVKLHNSLYERNVTNKLSVREGEVAKLAAFGLSNKEIASQIGITENSVKSAITMIMNKTGASDRRELGIYM